MRYGKLKDGAIEYAPKTLNLTANPTHVMKLASGWKPVLANAPAPKGAPDGFHFERVGLREQANLIVPKRRLVRDAPPPPRTFSKLKIVAALMEAGAWPQVKAWIEANGLYDLYLAAQDFVEDNEYFVQGLAALKPVVGWTDEQVEALLSRCVSE